MKLKSKSTTLIVLIFSLLGVAFFLLSSLNYKNNNKHKSFVPGSKWTDTNGIHINAHGGGVLYYNGVYYWYGEYKASGRSGNTSLKGVSCYTSKDLYNWKNEGIVLKVDKDPNSEITKGCVIERPKVVYNKKTGKFVLWFHLELKNQGYNAARTAVATSDTPTGPFEFKKSFRPNKGVWPLNFTYQQKKLRTWNKKELKDWSAEWIASVKNGMLIQRDFEKGQMSRDMTVFVDSDEKAYHIHASEENLTLHISELTDDYLDFTDKWISVAPTGHNEAPAIFKQDGIYYMITSGCTGWDPNEARSFKSTSIWGPWQPLGNPSIGKEAHLTFRSQSTFILPVQGKEDAFIFMADRWQPRNPIDGTYVWLPINMMNGKPVLKWQDKWDLNTF
ncbi:glycoside hydrolase family 43 protein [Mariniflexile litorale]|uniref:Glycoside hydrolase family 43 protein n=1 Tax=Mariniflexile litorale TaxID=3045158 RepID=A0AAU7EHD5_9FLAO|nr:glycoside hydrolase family 43 protein [Mariniflexile sp. KMM 9835]MDQ8210690.1 glycoside hydrolase family 43 protein [Mariniflexile sp. KMM 9835]